MSVMGGQRPFKQRNVLRTFNASDQTVSHIWICAEKMDFVKFCGDFRSKIPMQYEPNQRTLRELRHISTILIRARIITKTAR